MSENAAIKLRVWWIPQIPMVPFFYHVPSIDAGRLLLGALAEYDLFQLEHRVKPDFSNTGGMAWHHPQLTEDEWWDFDPLDEFDREEVEEAISKLESK